MKKKKAAKFEKSPKFNPFLSSGSFIGFEDDSSSDDADPEQTIRRRRAAFNEIPTPRNPDNLLDGLHLWLDRLFEGSTQRYYINHWPEFPIYKGQAACNLGSASAASRKKHAD